MAADILQILSPCLECSVRRFTCYGAGEDVDAAAISHIRQKTSVHLKGRTIYREGETNTEIYTLREGWAFRFTLLPDGRRQILSILLPGDSVLFPLLFVPRLSYSVRALTDVTLCAFSIRDMLALFRTRPALACQFETSIAHAQASADLRLIDLGQRTAQERVASFLLFLYLELSKRGFVNDNTIPFPLRLEHIADALGLNVSHVSRTLTALRREGLISPSRDQLIIHDYKGLAAIALTQSIET